MSIIALTAPTPTAAPAASPVLGAVYKSLECAVDMLAGTPVCVVANKFQPADNITNPEVIGILAADCLATFLGSAVISGPVTVPNLVDGAVYYLGQGAIVPAAPVSGRVVKLGTAISVASLVVNIQLSVLLS